MPLAHQASSPSRLFAEVTTGRLLRETALRREARDRSVSAKRDARVTVGAANASVVILFLREPRVLLRVWRVDAAVRVSRVVAFHVSFLGRRNARNRRVIQAPGWKKLARTAK
jgi:hypothetical protein